MNRPEKLTNGFITKARNCMKTHDFISCVIGECEELNKYCEEQEKKLKFRDMILSCIGETLVEESKMNITTKCAIKRIREYMCKLNDERKYIDE